jgi:hypothetical protein
MPSLRCKKRLKLGLNSVRDRSCIFQLNGLDLIDKLKSTDRIYRRICQHLAVFFSYNKLANSIFNHDLSIKQIWIVEWAISAGEGEILCTRDAFRPSPLQHGPDVVRSPF